MRAVPSRPRLRVLRPRYPRGLRPLRLRVGTASAALRLQNIVLFFYIDKNDLRLGLNRDENRPSASLDAVVRVVPTLERNLAGHDAFVQEFTVVLKRRRNGIFSTIEQGVCVGKRMPLFLLDNPCCPRWPSLCGVRSPRNLTRGKSIGNPRQTAWFGHPALFPCC